MRSGHQCKTILKKCCMKIRHFRFLTCGFRVLWGKIVTSPCDIQGRNNVVVKNSLIVNIIHNIFNFCDTDTVIGVILVIFKRASGLKHLIGYASHSLETISTTTFKTTWLVQLMFGKHCYKSEFNWIQTYSNRLGYCRSQTFQTCWY
jgi:hypothetical protein